MPGREAVRDTAAERAARAREQFLLAQALEREGAAAAAIVAYDLALRLDPALPGAHFAIGRLYLTRDEVRSAAQHFAAELEREPGHVAADRELGLALARLGDSTAAIRRLERLTRRRPGDDETWRALGFAYSVAGRTGPAEQALRHAVRLPPRRAIEHRDLGVLLAGLGRVREARAEYRAAARLDARDPTVWLNLGNLESRAGRDEDALAAYRAAEARDSSFALAVQGQIAALKRLERDEEAGRTYRRWLRLRADDMHARLEAVRHFAPRRPDIALEIARDGVRGDRRSADAHLVMGIAYQYAGQARAALGELRLAQSLYSAASPGRVEVERLVRTLRATAPDSLRALFEADSLAQAARAGGERRPLPPDSLTAR